MAAPFHTEPQSAAIETHLLGLIDHARCLALQRRLVDEIGGRNDGQIALLLCEHPNLITVGRAGSAADLSLESDLLRSHRLETRWVGRGGGCVVHTPGQLAIYPDRSTGMASLFRGGIPRPSAERNPQRPG